MVQVISCQKIAGKFAGNTRMITVPRRRGTGMCFEINSAGAAGRCRRGLVEDPKTGTLSDRTFFLTAEFAVPACRIHAVALSSSLL